MNYMKYNRTFVMLEEQNGRFASRSSAPVKGYLKVETGNNKGALRCVVQNLKYYEKGEYRYKLILFGRRGERTIHTVIGDLQVNRQGNGESYFRFLPEDLDGKGNPYHMFTTAIIAAASTSDEKEPLHPVLKGVTANEEDPFRAGLMNESYDLQPQNAEPAAAGLRGRQEDQSRPESQEKAASESDEQEYEAPETKEQEYEATGPKEQNQPKPSGEMIPEQQDSSPSKKVFNYFYNEYILNACAHTCRNAEFYEDITPFEKDRTGARWKKIVNVGSLPVVSPGAHYFSTVYRHYLFGARPDDSGVATTFFFGIPGRFMAEEQPDGGRSGFTYWQPIRGIGSTDISGEQREGRNRNAYGYWIIAVDGKTGNLEEV